MATDRSIIILRNLFYIRQVKRNLGYSLIKTSHYRISSYFTNVIDITNVQML
jgi:hypothetical protein